MSAIVAKKKELEATVRTLMTEVKAKEEKITKLQIEGAYKATSISSCFALIEEIVASLSDDAVKDRLRETAAKVGEERTTHSQQLAFALAEEEMRKIYREAWQKQGVDGDLGLVALLNLAHRMQETTDLKDSQKKEYFEKLSKFSEMEEDCLLRAVIGEEKFAKVTAARDEVLESLKDKDEKETTVYVKALQAEASAVQAKITAFQKEAKEGEKKDGKAIQAFVETLEESEQSAILKFRVLQDIFSNQQQQQQQQAAARARAANAQGQGQAHGHSHNGKACDGAH